MNENNSISYRQLMILFILSVMAPAVRIPSMIVKKAGTAAWLVPVAAFAVFIGLAFVIKSLYAGRSSGGLCDIITAAAGKYIGTAVCVLYVLWMTLLAAVYVRYYAERMLSTIMPDSSPEFLIAVIVLLVFLSVRAGAVAFARLGELLFGIFIVIFVAAVALALPDLQPERLLSVTAGDAVPVLYGAYELTSVMCLFTALFFMGDKLNRRGKILPVSLKAGAVTAVLCTAVFVAVIGILGPDMTRRSPYAFFLVIKNISILSPMDRIEPFILSLWTICDFIIVTMLMNAVSGALSSVLKLSEPKPFAVPLCVLLFALSGAVTSNFFDLESFSERVVVPVNVVMFFALPAVLAVVGKLRGSKNKAAG